MVFVRRMLSVKFFRNRFAPGKVAIGRNDGRRGAFRSQVAVRPKDGKAQVDSIRLGPDDDPGHTLDPFFIHGLDLGFSLGDRRNQAVLVHPGDRRVC